MTNWIRDGVNALYQRYSNHIDSCDICKAYISCEQCILNKGICHFLCPIGDSLEENWAQAEIEYSWQADFE